MAPYAKQWRFSRGRPKLVGGKIEEADMKQIGELALKD
jgi:hypothetical protein